MSLQSETDDKFYDLIASKLVTGQLVFESDLFRSYTGKYYDLLTYTHVDRKDLFPALVLENTDGGPVLLTCSASLFKLSNYAKIAVLRVLR